MSLRFLTVDLNKPELNIRCNNITCDGSLVQSGNNVVTFTPTLVTPSGTTTYTTQLGYAVVSGKSVYVTGRLACTSTIAVNAPLTINLTGLSILSLNTTVRQIGQCNKNSVAPVLQSDTHGPYVQVDQNSNNLTVYEGRGTSSASSVVNVPQSTAFDVTFNCTILIQ